MTSNLWFPEPVDEDPAWSNRRETTIGWLRRCTNERATSCRRFLNYSLSFFTPDEQELIAHALELRWESAFFELVVARVLQLLGATIDFEVADELGRRPDFTARFGDSSIVVEAAAPVVNGDVGRQMKDRIPLLEIIEDNLPDGWLAGVSQVPSLGPSDSKKRFKSELSRLLNVDPPASEDDKKELFSDTDDGPIEITLIAASRYDIDRLLWEPGSGYVDDTRSRIKHTLDRKRGQVRASRKPALLAIKAGGLSSDISDFDRALFGSTCSSLNASMEVESIDFLPNGAFARPGLRTPTYAGVLAFLDVNFFACRPPVLYLHPRFAGELPSGLTDVLELRSLLPGRSGIEVRPAPSVEWIEGLKLANM